MIRNITRNCTNHLCLLHFRNLDVMSDPNNGLFYRIIIVHDRDGRKKGAQTRNQK